MQFDQLREYYERRPFRPFFVHTADGEKALVEHPEFVSFAYDGSLVVVNDPSGKMHIIDTPAITQLEILATPPPKRPRGRKAA